MGAKNTRFWVHHPTEVPCFLKHLQMAQKTAKPLCGGSIPTAGANVFQMRQFYLAYRARVQTLSGQFDLPFPLSWSHMYACTAPDDAARDYYEHEALRGGWPVRDLDRQIATKRISVTWKTRHVDCLTSPGGLNPDDYVRDPFVLEFLNLKDEYSESDLEQALILALERFLLELGNEFAFVARQKRLRIGTEWYRVDLLFFHPGVQRSGVTSA